MDAPLKKILKAVTLELRHLLEGRYDAEGRWKPGDLEQRLAAIGVRRDRESAAVDELGHLPNEDKHARKVVDAYLQLREEAGVARSEAVADFVRETAYTWANRLLALRCMESRELIDEVILKKEVYGGRSLEHHRLAQRQPELCAGEDDGLFAVLDNVFKQQAKPLPMLFDPQAPGVALRPSAAKLRTCIELLSLQPEALRKAGVRLGDTDSQSSGDDDSSLSSTLDVFKAPDALGWAYQYWNTEEKDRVFEKVRTVKGAKIEGADIVPATQLYTESYMVQFLVQNSLGATWMGMHPESRLFEQWDYYVRDAAPVPVTKKPVRELTFLDPACGSGHFLLEAFDLFYTMYEEEGELTEPEDICDAILTKNLSGIDIDARSIQIAEAALWMKAAERAFDYEGVPTNLVAAVSSHLKGPHWEEFLASFEQEPSVARVLRKFGESMEHIDELGSLARPNEDLKKIIAEEHAVWEQQVREEKEANFLFPEMRKEAISGKLAFNEISDEEFGDRLFYRARAALDAFTEQARERGDFHDQFLATEASKGFALLELLGQKFHIIAANPPYMGTTQLSPAVSKAVASFDASPDLYCALLLRWLDLQSVDGRFAVVTRADYLTQSECEAMRHRLLERTSLRLLVRLENRVFRDLSNPNAIFFSMQVHTAPRAPDTQVLSLGLGAADFENKASELQQIISDNSAITTTPQIAFDRLPRNAFALNLPQWGYDAYMRHPRFGSFAAARQGLITGDTSRFLRFRWEVPEVGRRWMRYAKGGEFRRWYGNDEWAVDWGSDGARLRNFVNPETGKTRSRVQNTEFYFRKGATWSSQTVSAFATRLLEDDSIFDTTGSSAFSLEKPEDLQTLYKMMGILNCPAFGVLFRAIQPGVHFGEGYLETLPFPHPTAVPDRLQEDVEACVQIQKRITSQEYCSELYDLLPPATYAEIDRVLLDRLRSRLLAQVDLHILELSVWNLAETALGVPDSQKTSAIRSYANHESDEFLPQVWSGSSSPTAEPQVATHNSVEDACVKLQISPKCIRPLVETISEELVPDQMLRELLEDELLVVVLALMGHRWNTTDHDRDEWPKDSDGIVPLTDEADLPFDAESPLVVRIRRVLCDTADNSTGRNDDILETLLGKSLSNWINGSFFPRHVSRFRKRPIVWHIRSNSEGTRISPAYSCCVYYHRLDADIVRKVQKNSEDCRKSAETELRGILATPEPARSDRQEQRRGLLESRVSELGHFDKTLVGIIQKGFAPAPLSLLIQDAIDDATLSLKSSWLKRLSSLLADTRLSSWEQAAKSSAIHNEFPGWVSDSVSHLSHHCATVGIKPPKIKDVGEEPTSADFAKLICAQAKQMMKSSLKCACDAWWKQFDDIVLGPLKVQVKEMKAERKEIKVRLEADPAPDTDEVLKLKLRDKQLREDLKPIEKKIKTLKVKATKLREEIEAWSSDEPLAWESWLAEQPLFDEVASIDGKKAPPKTIAEFVAQESAYIPDLNDGVRVNIAPLQKAGILAADVLAAKDVDKAIADRAEWRADERRWVRQGRLPQPGWWPVKEQHET